MKFENSVIFFGYLSKKTLFTTTVNLAQILIAAYAK